jgi:hypothetical protein
MMRVISHILTLAVLTVGTDALADPLPEPLDCVFDVECGEQDCVAVEVSVEMTLMSLDESGLGLVAVSASPALSHVRNSPASRWPALLPDDQGEPSSRVYNMTSQQAAVQKDDLVLIAGTNAHRQSEFWTVVVPTDDRIRPTLHIQRMAMYVLPQRRQMTGSCKEQPA